MPKAEQIVTIVINHKNIPFETIPVGTHEDFGSFREPFRIARETEKNSPTLIYNQKLLRAETNLEKIPVEENLSIQLKISGDRVKLIPIVPINGITDYVITRS